MHQLKKIHRVEGQGLVADDSKDFIELLNYPVNVQFTTAGFQKMELEFKNKGYKSTIAIYGNFKSGKSKLLFYITSDFFGRVQRDSNAESYQVKQFIYDSNDNSYAHRLGYERSFGTLDKYEFPDDTLTHFSAKYLLGYTCQCMKPIPSLIRNVNHLKN